MIRTHLQPRALIPVVSTSSKRSNPFDDANGGKRQRLASTRPAETLEAWRSALARTALRDRTMEEAFLGYVAAGHAFEYRCNDEQHVFNALIHAEAYDTFQEVFQAFNRIPWTHTDKESRPEAFKLELQLPQNWEPKSLASMIEAFKNTAARRVVVHAEPSHTKACWAPRAVSDGLVAMLQSDTPSLVELVVNGPMEGSLKLANAIANGALESIAFGWTDEQHKLAGLHELDSYSVLAQACRSVRHICIDHPALLSLHTAIRDLPSPGSALSSVTFALEKNLPVLASPWDKDLQMRDFIAVAAEFETLTSVKGSAGVVDGESLKVNFIEPLTGCLSLEQVAIDGDQSLPSDPSTLNVLPMVATLSTTCPSLTQFEWTAGELSSVAGDNMRNAVRRSGDLAMAAAATTLIHAMVHPNFHLRSLTLHGLPLASGVLNAFFAALKTNKTIRHLDLRGCHIDLRSALLLLDVLKVNTTLETVQLPTESENYYVVTGDGKVHSFLENGLESGAESGPDKPAEFRLAFAKGATAAERALALAEFGPLENRANRLFAEVAAHNRRRPVLGL